MEQSLTITFDKVSSMGSSHELCEVLEQVAVGMGLSRPEIEIRDNQVSITVKGDDTAFDEFCTNSWYMDDVIKVQKKVGNTLRDVPCPG